VDGPRFGERSLAIIPPQHRAKAVFLQDNVARVLGGYLRGQLALALIIGVLAGVGTALLGLPYAVVLGVLAGLFELVPMFGPILSVIPAVLVALFMALFLVALPSAGGVDRRHRAGAGGRCCARIDIHAGRQARFVTAEAACDVGKPVVAAAGRGPIACVTAL
jgi:ABC-type dipeptide/oligopeptide/nickel transport system permease subunit